MMDCFVIRLLVSRKILGKALVMMRWFGFCCVEIPNLFYAILMVERNKQTQSKTATTPLKRKFVFVL